MSSAEPRFETPLPGIEVHQDDARALINRFRETFRKADPAVVPANLPTACILDGRKDRDYLTTDEFKRRECILFYLEGAEHLRRTIPSDVVLYISKREPWEDYDICLFDEDMSWCVGITHNDDIIVVD